MNKTIIFDLDGTLVDTAPDVALALNNTLLFFNLLPIKLTTIFGMMGKGARFMLDKAFRNQNRILNAEELDVAVQQYLIFYKDNPIVHTQLYPDVLNTLSILNELDYKLGICTNKPGVIARLVLDQLDLKKFFSGIICGDEIDSPKPHKQSINNLLLHLQGNPLNTVLVGDSEVDELCAKNSGVAFVGVSYGYGLNNFSSETVIDHFKELPSVLNKRFFS